MTPNALDRALAAQFIVAWAGEKGPREEPRLGWWRTDMLSKYGGVDLFGGLLPTTADWAIFQVAREAARRCDQRDRARNNDPDNVISLFHLGFQVDERLDERLQDHKRAGQPPSDVLPGIADLIVLDAAWKPDAFQAWARTRGTVRATTTPIGRRLPGAPPPELGQLVDRLVAALVPLVPLVDDYPMPHYLLA